jgi:hypothetical protein
MQQELDVAVVVAAIMAAMAAMAIMAAAVVEHLAMGKPGQVAKVVQVLLQLDE